MSELSSAIRSRLGRPPRVAFMTTVGHNVGDEFIREGIRSFLDEVIGDYDPYYVHKHNLATLHEPLLDECQLLADKFRDADLIVQAGAPVYWAFGPHRCYNVEWAQELWHRRIFLLGPAKPILNIGAGSCQRDENDLSPLLDDPKCLEFAHRAAAACRWTSVRDPLASKFLQAAGVEHELLACPALHAARRFMAGAIPQPRPLLALNFMPQAGHHVIKEQDPARWPEIVSRLVPILRSRYRLLFVAHDRAEADFQSALALPGERVFRSGDFRDYLAVYSRVMAVIANRVHGAVCAAGFGRPAVIVGNDSRLGIARPCSIPARDVNQATLEWIIGSLEEQLAHREQVSRAQLELRESSARRYVQKLAELVRQMW